MKSKSWMAAGTALAMFLVFLQSCILMPTEKQSVSELRPQIAFRSPDAQMQTACVIAGGLDMGAVPPCAQPGTHQLRVILGSQQLLSEKFEPNRSTVFLFT